MSVITKMRVFLFLKVSVAEGCETYCSSKCNICVWIENITRSVKKKIYGRFLKDSRAGTQLGG